MQLPHTTDEWTNLAGLAKAGEPEAVEALAEALGMHARKLFRCASLPVEDAEDLAQECVWHIFQRLNQFDGRKFSAWVHAILKNRLMDHFRSLRRRAPTVPSLEDEQDVIGVSLAAEPSRNGLLDDEGHAAVEEALGQISTDDRKLIESQTGFQKVSFRQMAEELGISEASARVRHHRARQKLKSLLENDPRMKDWLGCHSAA